MSDIYIRLATIGYCVASDSFLCFGDHCTDSRWSLPSDAKHRNAMATATEVDQTAKKLSPANDCPYGVDRDSWCPENASAAVEKHVLHLTVVVLGATGDLAAKKTFPALAALHSRGYETDVKIGRLFCRCAFCCSRSSLSKSPRSYLWYISSNPHHIGSYEATRGTCMDCRLRFLRFVHLLSALR